MFVALAAASPSNSSATLIAIAAIVAGAVVGVGAPFVAGRFQLSNTTKMIQAERERLHDHFSFQRGETDRAELRGILDALAEHLLAIEKSSSRLLSLAAMICVGFETPADGGLLQAARNEVREASEGIKGQTERLRLRLGLPGDALIDLALDTMYAAQEVRAGSTNPITDERLDQIRSDHEKVSAGRGRFLAAALQFTHARLHPAEDDEEQASAAASSPP